MGAVSAAVASSIVDAADAANAINIYAAVVDATGGGVGTVSVSNASTAITATMLRAPININRQTLQTLSVVSTMTILGSVSYNFLFC